MGRRPKARGRNIHGVLLLNKPAGLTSNDCLQKVKRLFNANRAGHTGSLDKPATGMLPICLGEATKLTSYLLDADKVYEAKVRLGIMTTTGDAAGDVLEQKPIPKIDKELLLNVIKQFVGTISQVPPMYSALKHQGQRLYKLAYQDQEVEREPRNITIYDIDLLEFDNDSFKIKVSCSKGTYIRSLAVDIGEKLGCGAHIETLHRIEVSQFSREEMVDFENIESITDIDSLLLPMDSVVEHLPIVDLEQDSTAYVLNGQAVLVAKSPSSGLVRLYDHEQFFIGIGHILEDGRVAPKRLFHFAENSELAKQ